MEALLFTDIEGSTRLWEEHGQEMARALARHDDILHSAVAESSGKILKTTGDGLIAVFPDATSSLSAALDAQQALNAEPWGPAVPIRVRIGVHAGDTEQRGGDLFGPTMNRAARIMAAGHGGQILISESAADEARGSLPPGASLRDLGMHRLKDLTDPEHLYQLIHDGLRSEFPPPRTLDGRPNNLPQQTTEFLGRESELAAIQLMLDVPTTRLLTIAGPGGAGKTRLGLQVAAEQLDRFPDGVFFVDLSSVREPDAVFETIARVLDIPLSTETQPLQILATRLRDSRMLLVLDNFEQVIPAGVGLSELLQRSPGLKVVVTSRETLRVRAEHVYPVPPMSLPDPRDDPDQIADSESARLFTDRARAVRPDFNIDADNAAIVAEICLRLDGLPLAIELAAARLNVFAPADLLARLRERLDVLGAGGRDLPDRQRTLWGAIGWSYELLDQGEKDLFEVMSVFAGATLTALEAVTGSWEVVDTVASLVDKSLVRSIDTGTSHRFVTLLMIREYAESRLAESPERMEAAKEAHAVYYAEFVAAMSDRLKGPDRQVALDELEVELGNLNSAWDHWVAKGDIRRLLGLIEAMWALHESKGWYREAIDLASEALAVLDECEARPDLAADELALRTSLARAMMAVKGYGVEVEDAFKRALEMSESAGTPAQQFPVLRALATYYMGTARFDLGVEYGKQMLALGESEGDESMIIEGHYVVGVGTAFTGDLENGLPHLDKVLHLHDPKRHDVSRFRLGPNTGVTTRVAYGLILWQCGMLQRGVELLGEALEVARQVDRPYSIAFALYHNGLLALYRGRFEECIDWAGQLARLADDNGYLVWRTLSTVLEGVSLANLGETDEGLLKTETAIDLYQGLTAPPVFWPLLLALRGTVHGLAGQPERGLQLFETAIEISGPEEAQDPEFRVLKGDVLRLLPQPDLEGAEAAYLSAARGSVLSGQRLVELQARNRLVELRREMGQAEDGSEDLASLYTWFTEGFEEQEMVRARALLGL